MISPFSALVRTPRSDTVRGPWWLGALSPGWLSMASIRHRFSAIARVLLSKRHNCEYIFRTLSTYFPQKNIWTICSMYMYIVCNNLIHLKKLWLLPCSAIWLNFPGLCLILYLSCLIGMVVYAFYSTCDPFSFHLVKTSDQVRIKCWEESCLPHGRFKIIPTCSSSNMLSGKLCICPNCKYRVTCM